MRCLPVVLWRPFDEVEALAEAPRVLKEKHPKLKVTQGTSLLARSLGDGEALVVPSCLAGSMASLTLRL